MSAPTCLIAEDEPLLAAALRQELAALWPELHVLATVGDGESALAQALALQPDVCIFDIRMPGLGGLEAAQALAEDWPDQTAASKPFPLLVFATAYDQYALAAFQAQAVDYLVKPLNRERLAACVSRLQARLLERRRPAASTALAASAAFAASAASTASAVAALPAVSAVSDTSTAAAKAGADDTLLQHTLSQLRALLGAAAAPTTAQPRLEVVQAQVGNLVHLVPVAEVVYFEAADKYVRVITAAREHLIRMSLRELLPQLDAQQFWQVHRSTVVQARAITSARREESGKVTLQLRGRKETLIASRLYAHLFRGM